MIMSFQETQIQEATKFPEPVYHHQMNFYHIGDVEYEKKFVFEELSEKNEFIQMFALRYLVYRYVNFIEPNEDQFDIDCYDLYATFLGAFEVIGKTKRLIGTVRIIGGDNVSRYAGVIKDIIESLDNQKVSYLMNRPTLFPIMQTFKIPESYLHAFSSDNHKPKEENAKPFELSRLAVLPEYWGTKARIESGLHELIILDSWKSKPKKVIYLIATHPRTRRKYKKLGFQIIPGTKEELYKGINQLAIAMSVNIDNYLKNPNPYTARCKYLYNSFLEKGYFEKR